MLYAKVKNGEIIQWPSPLPETYHDKGEEVVSETGEITYPNEVTVPNFNQLSDAELAVYGYLPHELIDPPHTVYDKFLGSTWEVLDDKVAETKQYQPKTAEEIANELVSKKASAERLLKKCDWAVVLDTPEKEEWIKYREILGNIAVNPQLDSQLPYPPKELF